MRATIASVALTFVMLTAPSATAQDISGTKQICLSTPGGPFTLCTFQTMAQCEQAKLASISMCRSLAGGRHSRFGLQLATADWRRIAARGPWRPTLTHRFVVNGVEANHRFGAALLCSH